MIFSPNQSFTFSSNNIMEKYKKLKSSIAKSLKKIDTAFEKPKRIKKKDQAQPLPQSQKLQKTPASLEKLNKRFSTSTLSSNPGKSSKKLNIRTNRNMSIEPNYEDDEIKTLRRNSSLIEKYEKEEF